jgi:small subunit ribosomal protein S6
MEERIYDLIVILRPDTPETDIDRIVATLEHTAGEKGAKFDKIEKWGVRRLAYRVSKLRQGSYLYMSFHSSDGDVIPELERRLKVSDAVIKYQTIRLDEEFKRQQKFTLHREKRAARRPRRATTDTGSGPGQSSSHPTAQSSGHAAAQPSGQPAGQYKEILNG